MMPPFASTEDRLEVVLSGFKSCLTAAREISKVRHLFIQIETAGDVWIVSAQTINIVAKLPAVSDYVRERRYTVIKVIIPQASDSAVVIGCISAVDVLADCVDMVIFARRECVYFSGRNGPIAIKALMWPASLAHSAIEQTDI